MPSFAVLGPQLQDLARKLARREVKRTLRHELDNKQAIWDAITTLCDQSPDTLGEDKKKLRSQMDQFMKDQGDIRKEYPSGTRWIDVQNMARGRMQDDFRAIINSMDGMAEKAKAMQDHAAASWGELATQLSTHAWSYYDRVIDVFKPFSTAMHARTTQAAATKDPGLAEQLSSRRTGPTSASI